MNQGFAKSEFDQFLTDTVTLRKADGTVHPDIRASVQNRKICLFDVALRIEAGDKFVRPLPSGQVEEFIVEEASYSEAFHGIPAQWTVTCRRSNQPPPEPRSVTYNVNGPNSRINVQSADHSTNIVHTDSFQVFQDMRRTVTAELASGADRAGLLERIEELEKACGTPGFTNRYQEFIAAAANHMTLLAPFLPALSALLR
jgi:hypothetical protein